jgi:hypothetical protein
MLQDARLKGIAEEFEKDVNILQEEFDLVTKIIKEREQMLSNYKKKEKELEDMIETIKDDEKKKAADARNEFSAFNIKL